MNPTSPLELAALGDLPDFRVCAEDTDPRGWAIVDSSSAAIGSVTDLIIDVPALIARYIVCSVARGARQVLIPVGFARLDDERRTVHLDFVTAADTDKLPAFTGLPLSEAYAAQIEKVLTGVAPVTERQAKIIRRDS